jgi:hypothetical protein
MINWLHDASILMQAVFLSGASVVLMWLGIIFIKPILRIWVRKQPGSNDLINYASAGFSLFYGLLLDGFKLL